MLFITVMSSEAVFVPKVLQVVEETKRIRHKSGKQRLYLPTSFDCFQAYRTKKSCINMYYTIPLSSERAHGGLTSMGTVRTSMSHPRASLCT